MTHDSASLPHAQSTGTPIPSAKTNRNLFWSGGSFLVTAILNFGTLYILTLLLSPDAMALVFIAVIFQDLALLFVDHGMCSYIVQAEKLGQREYASLFYQVLILSGILTIALSAMAPFLAAFFQSEPLTEALHITALSFVAIALSFPQKGMLQRNMHFKRIAAAEFTGMLLAALVTIALAYQGFGFKSYVYGFLIRKLSEAIVLWQKDSWIPKPALLLKPLRDLFQYSIYASNALILSYSVRLVDTFIVGHMLGVHILGLYSLASNIIFFPVNKCVLTFSRVFIVNFSQAKHETGQLRQTFANALGKLCLLLLPDLMRVFFKPAWLPVAELVRIMAVYGLAIAFLRMGESVLLALAKVRTVFIIHSATILLTALLMPWLITYGAAGAAWAIFLGALPSCWIMSRTLNTLQATNWRLILQHLRPGFFLALWLAFITAIIKFSLSPLIGRPAMLITIAATVLLAYGWVYRHYKKPQTISNT
jgi:O-antigen/teichoic acid export membrane protein